MIEPAHATWLAVWEWAQREAALARAHRERADAAVKRACEVELTAFYGAHTPLGYEELS